MNDFKNRNHGVPVSFFNAYFGIFSTIGDGAEGSLSGIQSSAERFCAARMAFTVSWVLALRPKESIFVTPF